MTRVLVDFDHQSSTWRLRCPALKWRYSGPDLTDAVGQLDALVDPKVPLDLKTDLGQDTDWYLILAASFRDDPDEQDNFHQAVEDSVFGLGLYGAPRATVLRLLRADVTADAPVPDPESDPT